MAQNKFSASPFDAIATEEVAPSKVPDAKQFVPIEEAEEEAPRARGAAPTRADVIREATAKGIDPAFVLSIWSQESGANWNSKDSPKGARGGMQVMPGTFKAMMGDADQRDPWNNLEAGLRYIQYGQKKLGTTDPQLLAAGYHAGYDHPDLKRGKIPNTNDGLIDTADYARSVAARAGDASATREPRVQRASYDRATSVQRPLNVRSDSGPDASMFQPMSDDEVKQYQATGVPDASRFIPLSDVDASSFVPMDQVEAKAPSRERTWGEVAKDTGAQLAEGVNNIIGAVPNLVAPEGKVAGFFNENADWMRDQQSDPLKAKIADADKKITAAGEDGVIAQIGEAASVYFTDPALAARFVTTNLPSMIPGIGAAKVAQAAAIARGASAARAAQVATTAAGATGAALNAGGARGEAFEDIKKTLMGQGMGQAEAEEQAIKDSRLVAAVGAAAGFVSGKTGLEGAIAGKAAGTGARKAVGAAAAELAGEQIEEVAPKLTTNMQASQYDDRSLGKDVGRTVVETAIGSGPGAALAGTMVGRAPQQAEPTEQPQDVPAQPAPRVEPTMGEPAPAGAGIPEVATPAPDNVAQNQEVAEGGAPAQAPQQAAPAAPPSGPLTAAVEAVAETESAAEQRVTVTVPEIGEVSGVMQHYEADENGNFVAEVVTDEGEVLQFTHEDGVTITPAAPVESGPLSAAVSEAAEQHAVDPAPAPVQPPAKPAEPDYASMDLPALRERMKYIAQQAKASGGWNKMFLDARKQVEKAIKLKTAEVQAESRPAEEPLKAGPFDDMRAANKMMLRFAEQTGQPHEVVEADGKFRIQPLKEQSDGRVDTAGDAPVMADGAAASLAGAAAEPLDQQSAGAGAAPLAPEQPADTGAPAADARPVVPGDGAAADVQPALTAEAAPAVEKPVRKGQARLDADRAKIKRQEDAVAKAAENIAKLKAEKEAKQPIERRAVEIVKATRSTSADVEKTLAGLPPVAEGYTRLFRAESPTAKFDDVFKADGLTDFQTDKPGARYTTDLKYADYYRQSYGRDASIHYIDVPNEVAEKGKLDEAEYAIEVDGATAQPQPAAAEQAPAPTPEAKPKQEPRRKKDKATTAAPQEQVAQIFNDLERGAAQEQAIADWEKSEADTPRPADPEPKVKQEPRRRAKKKAEEAPAPAAEASGEPVAEQQPEPAPAKGEAEPAEEQPAAKQRIAASRSGTLKPESKIADFGEKLGGAKKDLWGGFKDDLNAVADGDIAAQPLSKVWPAPDYQKMIDAGTDAEVVAVVRALRDEVPAKPRAAWKVQRWADQVKTLREFANSVMDGKTSPAELRKKMLGIGLLRGVAGRIDLYMEVGHDKSLEGVRFQEHHYSMYRGRENVNLWVVEKDSTANAFSNWPREIATGNTREEAIADFKAKYDSLDASKADKTPSFDIFSERGSKSYFVGKKIGRNYAKLAGPFASVKEARQYRDEQVQALQDKLEKFKEIPRERRDVNEPRVGEDMRNGQDVTPEMFAETFKFRGVEFGNWVEQKRRQQDLNDAFDALMDMAAVLGVKPAAISLNGQLGLAFGARGSGGTNPAAAHYEPGKIVINLTKRSGAGSLGHEWWHALDNYFSRMRAKPDQMMTEALDVSLAARGSDFQNDERVRRQMVNAFGDVVRAIKQTAIKARSAKLDAKRTKEYWTTGTEMSARAFESYLISKLQDQNASNDYLANIVSEKTWAAAEALGFELDSSYPYPTAGEIPVIRAAFDRFFQTVETREEGGRPVLYSTADDTAGAIRQLMADKEGSVTVAREGVGSITIEYGDKESGLAHIAARRGEAFMRRLPGLLAKGEVYRKDNQPDRIFIGNERDEAVIRLDRDGKKETWLLTAYEKHPEGNQSSTSEQKADEPYERLSDKEIVDALSIGTYGPVIEKLIDHGAIVLHRSAKTLPKEVKVRAGVQGVTTPDGTIHLVTGNLRRDNARAVLLHELFHSGARPLLGSEKWADLMGRMGSLYRQSEQSTGKAREFFDRARARVEKAKAKGAVPTRMEVEEFAAYAIEEYERAPDSLPAAIRKWVEDLIGMVKAFVQSQYGKQIGQITPAQLSGLSKLAIAQAAHERRGELFGKTVEALFSTDSEQVKTIEVQGERRPIENSNGQLVGDDMNKQLAFYRWFKDSNVVDEQQRPLVVYHGTARDIVRFDSSAEAREHHDWRQLGFWFTDSTSTASNYADTKPGWGEPDDMVKPGNILPIYLALQNPMALDYSEMLGKDAKAIGKMRKKAEANGYDGFKIGRYGGSDGYDYVAFHPEQIKSAVGNNGEFDPANADIRYSVADDADPIAQHIDRRPLSLAVEGGLARLKKDGILPMTPMNYLVDFARPGMSAVKEYMRVKRAMDTYRGDKHAEYDAHAQRWLKFNAKNKAHAQALADLMHESTIAQVDPSIPYSPDLTDADKAILKRQPKSEAAARIREKIENEPARKEAYDRLKASFDALPEAAKSLYRDTRDLYAKQAKELDQIIIENAERTMQIARDRAKDKYEARVEKAKEELSGSELDKELKRAQADHARTVGLAKYRDRARITALRQVFESNRLSGPYFPLARFGDYFVAVRDENGDIVSFSKFEKLADARKFEQATSKANPKLQVKTGVMSNKDAVRGAVDPKFLADIEGILEQSGVPSDVQDEVWQRYLNTMPDMSMRKRFIHRKGTAGYSRDALRSFASNMFHGSHQMARLKFSPQLTEALDTMRKQGEESDKPVDAGLLVNEFEQRHQWVMNPQGNQLAQGLSSAAFLWNLALTPAAAIVNTAQTFMMGVPVLGSRLGGQGRALVELAKASKQLVTSKKWEVENNPRLNAKEKEAMTEFYRLGLIDRTQSHDLAGVGETGVEYKPAVAKGMKIASFMYHHAERINREVTALAAYRMARRQGQGHEEAMEQAAEATWATHFDYSSSNRPRYMQGNWQKALLIHRQHSVNMTYRLFRDMNDALKGETPEVKKQARAQFVGILAMHGLMAGIKGIPFYGMAMIAAGLLGGFGDEDPPLPPEERLEKALREAGVPKWMMETLMYGAPSVASGQSVTTRIGFPDLFFRSPDKELEGKEEGLHYLEQFAGAGFGLGMKIAAGVNLLREGHFVRGMEKILPKAFGDLFKTGRYAKEGVLNMRGNPVVDELSAWELIGQAAGFTPHRVSQQYDLNNARMNRQAQLQTAKARLFNKAYLAHKTGDTEGFDEATKAIAEFAQKHPEMGIKGSSITSSIRTRMRNDARSKGGIILNKRMEGAIDEDLGLTDDEE